MPKSKIEACMICDEIPCSCGTVQRPKPLVKAQSPVETGPTPAQVAMQAQLAKQRREAHDKRFSPPEHRTIHAVDPDASSFALAIRALEPILHPDERATYRAILTAPPTLDVRAAGWRARRDHRD
jgi:hypothetical protein